MHRHIFKVGWLLTHSHQITTVLYYIIFLPGVLLREAGRWLAAGLLNVRADRSIQLPQKPEIGKLELNFIKLAPKTHPVKRVIIAAAPLVLGLLALWMIAVNAFKLETILNIAAPGQLDDVVRAASTLVAQADFWLWFYLAFTISNTMLPTVPADLRGWRRIGAAALPVMIIAFVLGISQAFAAEAGTQLLNSLALILSLTTLINVFMVIVLGTAEAFIKRLTGHSAAFQDGKMIAMTRQQMLQRKEAEKQQRQSARSVPARKPAVAAVTSIYMLKLPIPGPPGQEPVSRRVVAVLDAPSAKQEAASSPAAASLTAAPRPTRIDSSASKQTEKPAPKRQPQTGKAPVPFDSVADSDKKSERFAPFSRPFVKSAAITADDDIDAAGDNPPTSTDAPFMRPFADEKTPQDNMPAANPIANALPPKSKAETSRKPTRQSKSKSMPAARKTRPVPKPSTQAKVNPNPDDSSGYSEDQELKYEPIDDEYDLYDEADEDFYDDV